MANAARGVDLTRMQIVSGRELVKAGDEDILQRARIRL